MIYIYISVFSALSFALLVSRYIFFICSFVLLFCHCISWSFGLLSVNFVVTRTGLFVLCMAV